MRAVAAACAAAALAAGCASTQRVRIECVPEQVSVYVDGRLLEGPVDAVVLRTDEPHKIYVKGPGYEPRLVVLEPVTDADGRRRLDADHVCVEPVLVGQDRALELEVDREAESGPR